MTTTIEALQIACPDMRPIKFEDIRKGDVIARDHSDGDVLVRTAFRRADGSYWVDKDGCVVAECSKIASHYLLYRPKLELPTDEGALVRTPGGELALRTPVGWREFGNNVAVEERYLNEVGWERVYLTTQEPDGE